MSSIHIELTPLRVLVVEDSDDDAHLLVRHLSQAAYAPRFLRVQSAEAMAGALLNDDWDVVLADNAMPGFSAMAALEVLRRSGKDLPFIIVSGNINDAEAVAAMQAGAHDYMLKDNLARLVPVIQRELREAELRDAQRRAEHELRFNARHDPLTGLFNRREFEHRVELALQSAARDDIQHVACLLDLDRFKLVNDTCGHHAGDELLKQVARLLQTPLRGGDTLARLGGDEFGLLLERCTPEDATRVLTKLRDAIQGYRFSWDGRTFDLGVSIGVVPVTSRSGNVSELFSAVDVACDTAKELGRNRIHIYEPHDAQLVQRRAQMQWVSRITQALDQNRLVLFQQPIMAMHREVSQGPCKEILLRLVERDGSLVLPGAFIPAAERYKLMPALDRWVVHALFRHLRALSETDALEPEALFFVNLSGASLTDEGFLEFVQHSLLENGVRGTQICFEITESAAIGNLAHALRFFNGLRSLGCRFALDDFGSGLSSFGYLKSLPVDFLKIDGSFIRDMANDPIDYAMVEAINKIGHIMRLKTVAESVENAQTLELVRELGVDYAQGYTFARPQPLE